MIEDVGVDFCLGLIQAFFPSCPRLGIPPSHLLLGDQVQFKGKVAQLRKNLAPLLIVLYDQLDFSLELVGLLEGEEAHQEEQQEEETEGQKEASLDLLGENGNRNG